MHYIVKVLIVSATDFEVRPLFSNLAAMQRKSAFLFEGRVEKVRIDLLVTGVGAPLTAYHIGRQLAVGDYDFALNAGICGAYRQDLKIGDVVSVSEEEFGDLGADTEDTFLSVFDLGLMDRDTLPFTDGKLINNSVIPSQKLEMLPKVEGFTVTTLHDNPAGIEQVRKSGRTGVETMEGASFFYGCLLRNIPFAEIRSVSNYVEDRDKSKWDVKLAIENLNDTLRGIIKEIAR
jgi:futalosine hydrolase